MAERPLVSIVTPSYNAAPYLEELLQSVEAQDYPRIEHIVIDDGSTDQGATLAILRRHPSVRWWSRANRGQYATLNEGFRAATGDYITTISADDKYADAQAIGAMADLLMAHPDRDVAHGYTLHTDQSGTPLPIQPYQRYSSWMVRYNLGCILHCSMLIRREKLIRDNLFFDESLRFIGDADWLIRLYLAGCRFGRIDRYIAAYRHHDDQVTARATADSQADVARRAEHAAVLRRYHSSRVIKKLVTTYDTFHQRRVKMLAAWRRGGAGQVLKVTSNWLHRRRHGH